MAVNHTAVSCDWLVTYYGTRTWAGGFMQRCLGRYRDYGFQQGIDGFLNEVDSVTLVHCEAADYRAFVLLQICCPGKLTTHQLLWVEHGMVRCKKGKTNSVYER